MPDRAGDGRAARPFAVTRSSRMHAFTAVTEMGPAIDLAMARTARAALSTGFDNAIPPAETMRPGFRSLPVLAAAWKRSIRLAEQEALNEVNRLREGLTELRLAEVRHAPLATDVYDQALAQLAERGEPSTPLVLEDALRAGLTTELTRLATRLDRASERRL